MGPAPPAAESGKPMAQHIATADGLLKKLSDYARQEFQ
jgi:hypothetical protein